MGAELLPADADMSYISAIEYRLPLLDIAYRLNIGFTTGQPNPK